MNKKGEIPRVPQFTSPTDDITVAEAFLLNLKDPLQLKKDRALYSNRGWRENFFEKSLFLSPCGAENFFK